MSSSSSSSSSNTSKQKRKLQVCIEEEEQGQGQEKSNKKNRPIHGHERFAFVGRLTECIAPTLGEGNSRIVLDYVMDWEFSYLLGGEPLSSDWKPVSGVNTIFLCKKIAQVLMNECLTTTASAPTSCGCYGCTSLPPYSIPCAFDCEEMLNPGHLSFDTWLQVLARFFSGFMTNEILFAAFLYCLRPGLKVLMRLPTLHAVFFASFILSVKMWDDEDWALVQDVSQQFTRKGCNREEVSKTIRRIERHCFRLLDSNCYVHPSVFFSYWDYVLMPCSPLASTVSSLLEPAK